MKITALALALILISVIEAQRWACPAEKTENGLPQALPETVGLISARLKNIDKVVEAAIVAGDIPGAVVLIGRHGRCAFLKAFGQRAVKPVREPMTTDTIFDMASLTKVLATTPSVMRLTESGSIRLDDKVKRYLPRFTGGGKDAITVRQLLTHYSGLPPDFDLSKRWTGYEGAMDELWRVSTQSEPGKEYVYSDLNFIALGEIVRRVSGSTLDIFAREHIFAPLGMTETTFNPPESWRARIAPTEPRSHTIQYLKGQESESSEAILRGEVHDPTAWRMGGVAGHAGVFSTARDLAVYAQALLNRGSFQGARILSPRSIEAMTSRQSPKSSPDIRGFGWDIDTNLSSPRGDIFAGGYGHTGFTGTSIWILPDDDLFMIILTNRVHPDGKGEVNHLRGAIANVVSASIADPR